LSRIIGWGVKSVEWSYESDKLIQVLEDFWNITGINIAVFDGDHTCIADPQRANPFCRIIQETPEGKEACDRCDRMLFERCQKNGRGQRQVCHAGLTDAAVPIIYNGLTVGYVIFGQVRRQSSRFVIPSDAPYYAQLANVWNQLPVIEDRVFDSVISLGVMVAAYILTEKMIAPDKEELATAVGNYLAEHMTEQPLIDELCYQFHTSKNTLYREFRERYHCTVNEYLLQRRVEAAQELLKKSEKSIIEVGEEVGFGSYCNFCRFFKRETGLSPSEYRKLKTTGKISKKK